MNLLSLSYSLGVYRKKEWSAAADGVRLCCVLSCRLPSDYCLPLRWLESDYGIQAIQQTCSSLALKSFKIPHISVMLNENVFFPELF